MTIEACPFCGGSAKLQGNYSEKHTCFYVYVQCRKCGARGTVQKDESAKNVKEATIVSMLAIEAWNNRAERQAAT